MTDPVPGARSFATSGTAYDHFMGRYSRPLAVQFAAAADLSEGQTVLDVGCGPGALTGVLADRVGNQAVSAVDPSPSFVAECAAGHPGVDVRFGRAEAIPFTDATFDRALAQLVLHFVSDPALAARELHRVLRPGGLVAACVWDGTDGVHMLGHFFAAARAVGAEIPEEATTMPFSRSGEIVDLFAQAGFATLTETTMTVSTRYSDFDELWSGFLAGIGPAGAYCLSLSPPTRAKVRAAMFAGLGSPAESFTLSAVARSVTGRVPQLAY